jgi:hypothetical protein
MTLGSLRILGYCDPVSKKKKTNKKTKKPKIPFRLLEFDVDSRGQTYEHFQINIQ